MIHIVIVCILAIMCLSLWVSELVISIQRNDTIAMETSQKYAGFLLDVMLSDQNGNTSWENPQQDLKNVYKEAEK